MPRRKVIPIPVLTQKDITRFWSKIDKAPGQGPNGECWLWTGAGQRYGTIGIQKIQLSTHRIAFRLHYGFDPVPETLHSCDTPKCCNPFHLSAGTNEDNALDRVTKGRSEKGSDRWSSKLTPEQVLEIRKRYSHTARNASSLGREFGRIKRNDP